ncbi:hypothetical protein [Solitalea lacus]|uniref:hypothetical protein n=1 Tax=Solitalea lacus TaxID=2911172 RepID=UPI001EDA8857|nr:hypothetical protein [Solitalea lacus]UKJ08327.1 hypothetical protein L2B55_03945 [Solitalea lacus]
MSLTSHRLTDGFYAPFYKGHGNVLIWKNDNLLTNIAGIMAIVVALVPTNPNQAADKIYSFIPYAQEWLGTLHYVFAVCCFWFLLCWL